MCSNLFKTCSKLVQMCSNVFKCVRKLARQSNDRINEYASKYKKKAKLERAVNRFELRYQNALDEDGCRRSKLKLFIFANMLPFI